MNLSIIYGGNFYLLLDGALVKGPKVWGQQPGGNCSDRDGAFVKGGNRRYTEYCLNVNVHVGCQRKCQRYLYAQQVQTSVGAPPSRMYGRFATRGRFFHQMR